MFKFIKKEDQLRAAQAEIVRLKAIIGELPQAEEGEEGESQPTLVERILSQETELKEMDKAVKLSAATLSNLTKKQGL